MSILNKLFSKKKEKPSKKAAKKPEKEIEVKKKSFEGPEIIRAKVIVEVAGFPKEHVEETLKGYVEKIKQDKNLEILNVDIAPAEQRDKFFATFAEIEMKTTNIHIMLNFCFDYMPASIEIIEPEMIQIKPNQLSAWLNDLQMKLHNLDMYVKTVGAENETLRENSSLVLRNNILLSLKDSEKTLEIISKNIGIAPEKTEQFLEKMVEQGYLKKKGVKYSLNEKKVKFSNDI